MIALIPSNNLISFFFQLKLENFNSDDPFKFHINTCLAVHTKNAKGFHRDRIKPKYRYTFSAYLSGNQIRSSSYTERKESTLFSALAGVKWFGWKSFFIMIGHSWDFKRGIILFPSHSNVHLAFSQTVCFFLVRDFSPFIARTGKKRYSKRKCRLLWNKWAWNEEKKRLEMILICYRNLWAPTWFAKRNRSMESTGLVGRIRCYLARKTWKCLGCEINTQASAEGQREAEKLMEKKLSR